MDTQIIVALITSIGQIIPACITACFGILGIILGAYFTARLNKVEQNTLKVEQSVEKISESLPSLKLLLEHNANGDRLKGNIIDLIDAVSKGYPIKIKIHHKEHEIETIDAQSLYVDNNVVFASNTSLISTTRDNEGDHIYQNNSYHYYLLVGSNGSFHQKRIYMDGTQRNTSKTKKHMSWISVLPIK